MPKRKKRKTQSHGVAPKQDAIRANWTGLNGNRVRLAISEDLINDLKTMHDAVFGAVYQTSFGRYQPNYDPMAGTRVFFTRFADWSLPVVHMRIEPPTYNPKGHKIWRTKHSRQYFVEVYADALGLRHNLAPLDVGHLFDVAHPKFMGGGMLLTFPDAAMAHRGKVRKVPKNFAEEPLMEGASL